MAPRKAFPLRLEPGIYDALHKWADAEMRSVNAQIEFLLRGALERVGRLPQPRSESGAEREDDPTNETRPE